MRSPWRTSFTTSGLSRSPSRSHGETRATAVHGRAHATLPFVTVMNASSRLRSRVAERAHRQPAATSAASSAAAASSTCAGPAPRLQLQPHAQRSPRAPPAPRAAAPATAARRARSTASPSAPTASRTVSSAACPARLLARSSSATLPVASSRPCSMMAQVSQISASSVRMWLEMRTALP